MNLEYRNVYQINKKGVRYGCMIFQSRKWADISGGRSRIGIETIYRAGRKYAPNHIVVVFYQPTK